MIYIMKIIKNEFSKGMHSCTYQIHCGKEISDYLNQEFYTQEIKNERLMNKAKEYAIRAMKGQVITNAAGHNVDQRFYDAVPRPVTSLFNYNVDGIIVS